MAILEARDENDQDRTDNILSDGHGHVRIADLERTTVTITERVEVPGIVDSVAYAAEDALGTQANIVVPVQGNITAAQAIDTDDNNIPFNILIFNAPYTPVADNAPFTLNINDYDKLIGILTVDTFVAVSGDTIGQETGANLAYETTTDGLIYCQLVTTSTPNYAAGTGIFLSLTIESKEVMFA